MTRAAGMLTTWGVLGFVLTTLVPRHVIVILLVVSALTLAALIYDGLPKDR